MIGVVYLGSNPKTEERLRYIPGRLVQYTRNYKDAASACSTHVRNEHFIVFYEQGEQDADINAINYLKKKNKHIYIILLTKELTAENRSVYQKSGINDTLDCNASITELNKKIQFISDRENMLFDDQQPKYRMLRFKIPLWKRVFDVLFAIIVLILTSPIFILTAIAIRLESKGPVIFKSKRVGANYTIFNFLKFRSMYQDAEERLKEVAKEAGNQYAEMSKKAEKTPMSMPDFGMGGNMMISDDTDMMIADDEVMLVGDDFVISETDYSKEKKEEINNAFVKIENDPIDRFMAPAGLTGLWQVEERGKGGMMSAEERKQLDIKYGQTYNFWLDMKILFRTFFAFVQKENV